MQNWFGQDIHPSDHLIHWRDGYNQQPRKGEQSFEDLVKSVRVAWDLTHATPTLTAASKLLLERQRFMTEMSAAEDAAGESM